MIYTKKKIFLWFFNFFIYFYRNNSYELFFIFSDPELWSRETELFLEVLGSILLK